MPSASGSRYWGSLKREQLEKFQAKYPNTDLNLFIKTVIDDILNDRISATKKEELDLALKQAKLENLGYKNQIDRIRATHWETFGKEPSLEARAAIEQRLATATTGHAIVTPPPVSINAADSLRFMKECRKNDLNQWVIICTFCTQDFIHTMREIALAEFQNHLKDWHKDEILT